MEEALVLSSHMRSNNMAPVTSGTSRSHEYHCFEAEAGYYESPLGPPIHSATLDGVVSLNNTAASLLQSNEFHRSKLLLTRALSLVQPELKRLDQPAGDMDGRPRRRSLLFSYMGSKGRWDLHAESTEGGFIFALPSVLSLEQIVSSCAIDPLCRDGSASIVFSIVFNLGLCHHRLGLVFPRHSARRRDTLLLAVEWYSVAFRIQQHIKGVPGSFLELLALINNISEVHDAMNQQEAASACRQRLLEMHVFFVDSVHPQPLTPQRSWVSSYLLSGVLKNIEKLVFSKSNSLAAAA